MVCVALGQVLCNPVSAGIHLGLADELSELLAKTPGRLVAVGRIALQRPANDRRQGRRHIRNQRFDRWQTAIQGDGGSPLRVCRRNEALNNQCLPQQNTHTPNVDALVQFSAKPLLGRHVTNFASDTAYRRAGQAGGRTGNAEVQQHHRPLAHDKDVAWSDVAVDDVQWPPIIVGKLVGVVESTQYVEAQATDHPEGQAAFAPTGSTQDCVEPYTVEVVHDQTPIAVNLFELEAPNDIGVIEASR
jgi:hypothetical protein